MGLIYAAFWIGALAVSRISSVGGMTAAISAPIAALLLGHGALFQPLAAMAALLLWKHRPNILRLMRGQEPRVGQKPGTEAPGKA